MRSSGTKSRLSSHPPPHTQPQTQTHAHLGQVGAKVVGVGPHELHGQGPQLLMRLAGLAGLLQLVFCGGRGVRGCVAAWPAAGQG